MGLTSIKVDSVSGAGDVNGDGLDDVIEAYHADPNGNNSSVVSVLERLDKAAIESPILEKKALCYKWVLL